VHDVTLGNDLILELWYQVCTRDKRTNFPALTIEILTELLDYFLWKNKSNIKSIQAKWLKEKEKSFQTEKAHDSQHRPLTWFTKKPLMLEGKLSVRSSQVLIHPKSCPTPDPLVSYPVVLVPTMSCISFLKISFLWASKCYASKLEFLKFDINDCNYLPGSRLFQLQQEVFSLIGKHVHTRGYSLPLSTPGHHQSYGLYINTNMWMCSCVRVYTCACRCVQACTYMWQGTFCMHVSPYLFYETQCLFCGGKQFTVTLTPHTFWSRLLLYTRLQMPIATHIA